MSKTDHSRERMTPHLEELYRHLTAINDKGEVVVPHRYVDGKMRIHSKKLGNKSAGQIRLQTVAVVIAGLTTKKFNLRMSRQGHAPDTPSIFAYESIYLQGVRLADVTKPEGTTIIGTDQSSSNEPFNSLREGDPETSVRYRRNYLARLLCLEHHGSSCKVCGITMPEVYGVPAGAGYLHIHHLTPFRKGESQRPVVPAQDLIPVCPNCHSMLHRSPDPQVPYTPEELRSFMENSQIRMAFEKRGNEKSQTPLR